MKRIRERSLRRKRRAQPSVRAERARQFTIRNVPPQVAGALKRKAAASNCSLNQFLVQALSREAGAELDVHDDLDFLVGSWEDDPAFEQALEAQDEVDESLWR
jgi:hypothetical protein